MSGRTLYKYVAKGGWRRRHATQDIASAVQKRAAKRKPRLCVTLKGAGGRFIRTADAGAPVRRGLKALDPVGEAAALALAADAAMQSDEAMMRTQRLRETTSDVRMLVAMVDIARSLTAAEDAGEREAPGQELDDTPRRRARKRWRPPSGA